MEHIHKHGFVHRDFKPENVLCSRADASKISLIDFGISQRIGPAPPAKYDPLKESKHIVGTLHWASLNAHDGIGGWLIFLYIRCLNSLKIIDLGPRDDLESLAYIALFLLRGGLPWRTSSSDNESMKKYMQRIRASKAAASGDKLGATFPAEFGLLLDYSRGLEYDQMPDHAELKRQFTDLVGGKDADGPLDWTSVGTPMSEEHNGSEIAHSEDDTESDDDDDDESNEEESFENSYFNWDIADWDIQGARDKSLTLPVEQVELADSSIPQIVEVTE